MIIDENRNVYMLWYCVGLRMSSLCLMFNFKLFFVFLVDFFSWGGYFKLLNMFFVMFVFGNSLKLYGVIFLF